MGIGWYEQEAEGVWSGEKAELLLKLPSDIDSIIEIVFGFCEGTGDLKINFNGNNIINIQNNFDWNKKVRITLPKALYNDGLQVLEFHTLNPTMPNGFNKKVGIFIKSLSFIKLYEPFQSISFGYNVFTDYSIMETAMSEIKSSNSTILKEINDSVVAARCMLPEKTRFRLLKRLIRRSIKVYTAFQIEFNLKISNFISALLNQMSSTSETIIQIQHKQQEQLEEFYNDYISIKNQIDELKQENAGQIVEINNTVNSIKEKIDFTINNRIGIVSDLVEKNISASNKQYENLEHEIKNQWTFNQNMNKNFESQWEFNNSVNNNFNNLWENALLNNKNFESIWNAYQCFRRELFYELDFRLRNSKKATNEKDVIKPKIKDNCKDKISHNNGKLRINLGSGPFDVEGYLSIDARDLPNVDIVSDVANLPFESESVDEIYSAHLLEHFEKLVLEKELLPYWFNLLKSDGVFTAIVPDMDAMANKYVEGNMTFSELSEVIMGSQDYKLDYHYSVFSPELLVDMLNKAGFAEIEIKSHGRKNGMCYEMEIVAKKP